MNDLNINISNNKTTYVKSGLTFTTALTLLFIALKLTGQITWSWFFVLLPMFALVLAIAIIIAIVGGILGVCFLNNKKNTKKAKQKLPKDNYVSPWAKK